MKKYIYFDNAATTISKPECVSRAVITALERFGNPGRSGHDISTMGASQIYNCRESICRLFGLDKPERVVFTNNATTALNIAIKGYVQNSSHIIISNLEHNSVIRPVHALSESSRQISYSIFDATVDDNETIFNFVSRIRPETKVAVVTFASNVCGKILPIARISDICKNRGILLICDASQGAGCVPINIKTLGIDVLCFAGHKSLYGPQGTGGLVICTNKEPTPFIEGGNGVNSIEKTMQGPLPEMLEAGTLNTPGICGLGAAIGYISKIGINEIYERNNYLINNLTEGLQNIHGVTTYGLSPKRTATIIFNKKGICSEELAAKLNENKICVRGGFHCAPLSHMSLGTGECGAVRASLSFTNTTSEIDTFLYTVDKI